jgi:uncharacterized Zn finger protein
MFLRRRTADLLRQCPACGSLFACPMHWEPSDDMHWHIELRCGDCGHWWELEVEDSRAARYDIELDEDRASIKRTVRRLDLERMSAEADAFAIALSRDLIEPTDFVT